MGIEESFQVRIENALSSLVAAGRLALPASVPAFSVERPKQSGHGDVACNAALVLAKVAGKKPREIADLLAEVLRQDPWVESIEVAGPGFVNATLRPEAFHPILADVLNAGAGYGRAAAATGERILVEFVSANPTGPLLVSHARGALLGDVIARLFEATGHRVTREYYVNDFGNQVHKYARSVVARAFEEPLPEDGYPGEYVHEVARFLLAHHRDVLEAHRADREDPVVFAELSRLCVTRMLDGIPGSTQLAGIKSTLRSMRVEFDSWFSEDSLHRWGRVSASLQKLSADGYIKKLEDGVMVFQMPEGVGKEDKTFAGDKGSAKKTSGDTAGGRVVQKSDGKTYTYFASDIAYHVDKLARGFDRMVNVLGADHGGYVARIENVLLALGLPAEKFDPILFQLVTILRNGQEVRMGKRLGNAITADELIEEIDQATEPGACADALRYFYLSRGTTTNVLFDIEEAKKQSLDNPAIYFQYGHARACSILRAASDRHGWKPPRWNDSFASKITRRDELDLLQQLGAYPRVVRDAAAERAPVKIVEYIKSLTIAFQAWYTQSYKEKDPVLPLRTLTEVAGWEANYDVQRSLARLGFVEAVRVVFASGLGLLGIRAPDRMKKIAQPADNSTDEQDD
jgi:arginyl-tRNA synthetase